ncbi:MAG: hypothetical protein QXJ02_01880 [Candidatus Bathyarchaeia archaeon]
MKADIAVATVSGKAYYLIVSEMRKKNLPFLSLTPNDPIPAEIKVVITTEKEKPFIHHEKILTYQDEDVEALIDQALRIVQGKEKYEKLVIGIDPGEVTGLAVLADGKVIETQNCFSITETLEKVNEILKNCKCAQNVFVSVKIGDGVPKYKEELLQELDKTLSSNVVLESVSEAGTSHSLKESSHRRGLRDMASAIRIAGRNGHVYPRRKMNE